MSKAKATRMQHFILADAVRWPKQPIGIMDVADILGTHDYTIKRALQGGRDLFGVKLQDLGYVEVVKGRECIRCRHKIMNVRCTMYCENCRHENRRRGNMLREKREQEKKNMPKSRSHEVPYEEKSPLSKVAWDARQAGMSYGKYLTAQNARWFK